MPKDLDDASVLEHKMQYELEEPQKLIDYDLFETRFFEFKDE